MGSRRLAGTVVALISTGRGCLGFAPYGSTDGTLVLRGFAKLTRIGGRVVIQANDNLTRIGGLAAVLAIKL